MEFAENNRISHRQLYRQVVMAFLAPFLLCLFGRGRILGLGGIAGTAAALVLLMFYVIFLIRLARYCEDLKKAAGGFWGRLMGAFFVVYVILTAAYLLSLLEEIVPKSLVTGVSGRWISFFAILVCSMGTHRGMQRRGRIAEVSGGIVLLGIVVMMILCVKQGEWTYLEEMLEGSRLTGRNFLESTYGILCGFAGLGLLPFVMEHVEKQSSAGRSAAFAVLTLGGILIAVQLILPAVFGWERLKTEEFPILPLMAGADLPGNVLARFDVIWMGFLLYSLLFSIGSLLHYGHQIIRKAHLGTGRLWMAAAVYALSILEIGGMGIEDYFLPYLGYIFVPGLLLLQVVLFMLGRGKWKKKTAAVAGTVSMVLCFSLILGGCGAVEPEKRMYPLALGVDLTTNAEAADAAAQNGEAAAEGSKAASLFQLTYGMPDLPKATGQDKSGEEEGNTALTISGQSFADIEAEYNRTQEKYLDMGHLQVLILGDGVLKNNLWETVLDYLEEEPYVGENVYVFRTSDAKKALNWQGAGGTSIGEYLQGLLENRTPPQEKDGTTLRELYHARYQSGILPDLPEIVFVNDEIQVNIGEKITA